MLVLTRKVGERIFIGEGIIINVLGVEGHKVRLGIVAPKDVCIVREELAGGGNVDLGRRPSVGRSGSEGPRP